MENEHAVNHTLTTTHWVQGETLGLLHAKDDDVCLLKIKCGAQLHAGGRQCSAARCLQLSLEELRSNAARHSLHVWDLSQLEVSQSDRNPKQISVLIERAASLRGSHR